MKKQLLITIGCLLIAFILIITAAVFFTLRSLSFLRQGNLAPAQQQAQAGLIFIKPVSQVTFHRLPDLEAGRIGLELITQANTLANQAQQYGQHIFEPAAKEEADQLKNTLSQLSITESEFKKNYLSSYFLTQFINPSRIDQLDSILNDINQLSQTLLTGQHQYLVILQNSHELRATGGFMGTYAKITLDDGQITAFDVQDIYEPDGQFNGYVTPPPGVNEYLSSGKGLRLPDANWHPDFPASSRQILDFFALGKKEQLEGVIAINLTAGENLLSITGPVYLSDYQLSVDANNLAEVARADRANFFPGSQQKPDFFSHLFTQLKLKLESLSPDQQSELAKLLMKSLMTKDIQLFSTDQQLQTIFAKHQLAGQLLTEPKNARSTNQPARPTHYLYLVESNVGINKANREITREVGIELGDYRTTVAVNFHNQNSRTNQGPDSLHYINYQRLIIPTNYSIHQLVINNQTITKFDESVIKNSQGDEFKQIGFLVAVSAGESNTLAIELANDQLVEPVSQPPSIFIQKQPGLPATPYTIKYQDQTKNLLLEQDSLVSF